LFPGGVPPPDVAGDEDDVEDEEQGGHEGDRDNDTSGQAALHVVRFERQRT